MKAGDVRVDRRRGTLLLLLGEGSRSRPGQPAFDALVLSAGPMDMFHREGEVEAIAASWLASFTDPWTEAP